MSLIFSELLNLKHLKSLSKKFIKLVKNIVIKSDFLTKKDPLINNFNKTNPLGGNGERVDINLTRDFNFDVLDMYQKNHFKRYEFATNLIKGNNVCGDFACGTGYGSIMLSKKAEKVIGADISIEVISGIKRRYKSIDNAHFVHADLLNLSYNSIFDTIISFETIEHFNENDINSLLSIFCKSLKPNGKLIISTPYIQEKSEAALKLGHHLTFHIDEEKIAQWLSNNGFQVEDYFYQNYDTHMIEKSLIKKDFIVCIARKN